MRMKGIEMNYGMYYFFYKLFEQNKDAILALPTEVKTIFLIALVLSVGSSLIKKATRFLKWLVFAAIIYFALVYLNVI